MVGRRTMRRLVTTGAGFIRVSGKFDCCGDLVGAQFCFIYQLVGWEIINA